jgi:hypothetical protein
LQAREQARRVQAVLVVEHGAPRRWRWPDEAVVDEVHLALVRVAFLVGEAEAHRVRLSREDGRVPPRAARMYFR